MCDKKKNPKKKKKVVLSFGKGIKMKLFEIPDDYVPPEDIKRPEQNQESQDQD